MIRSESVLLLGGNGANRLHPRARGGFITGNTGRLAFVDQRYDGPGGESYRRGPMARLPGARGTNIMFQFQDENGPWWWLDRVGGEDGKWRFIKRGGEDNPQVLFWEGDETP